MIQRTHGTLDQYHKFDRSIIDWIRRSVANIPAVKVGAFTAFAVDDDPLLGVPIAIAL